jgi:hypothetical protein
MDEATVSVRGGRHYLYRAVDKHGQSVDSLLCAERGRDAAQSFFRKAVDTKLAALAAQGQYRCEHGNVHRALEAARGEQSMERSRSAPATLSE